MKVTLDLDQLLADGKITRAEYEKLGATPGTVLIAGLLALGFAAGLRSMNAAMRETA